MPLVPLTALLAIGILLAHVAWQSPALTCVTPGIATLHTTPALQVAIALLPLALLPLARLSSRPSWQTGEERISQSANQRILNPKSEIRNPKFPSLLLRVTYLLLGILLYLSRPFDPCLPPDHIGTIAADLGARGRTVILTGIIDGWPDVRARRTFYRLRAEDVRTRGRTQPAHGHLLLQAPRYPAYRYGDRVRVVGTLRQPPVFEDFDYRRYLARKGIHALLRGDRVLPLDAGHGSPFWNALYGLRARASRVINAILPEPHAALANGILLGIETGIPPDLYDDFNATGTSHIIVISGFNIAIIASLLLALLTPLLGRRRAALLAILGIALYVLLVGADAAVVRAGIMGILYAATHLLRRQTHVLNTLFASALLMLVHNPLTLWDLGFQLSFLATLGLIVLLPDLQRPVRRRLRRLLPRAWYGPAYDLLNEALIVTTAAQLATTPLIIATFGRLSLISLLTNLLILPVQPLIMIGGGISTLAGLLWLPLGRLLGLVPLLPLAWTVAIVRVTAAWPGAGLPTPDWMRPLALLYYLGFAAYVAHRYRTMLLPPGTPPPPLPGTGALRGLRFRWKKSRSRSPHRAPSPRAVGVALAAAALPLAVIAFPPAADFTLTLLPGTHTLLETPDHLRVLLPARGPRPDHPRTTLLTPALRRHPARLWVLTHTDADTLTALRLLLQDASPALVLYPAYRQTPPLHAFLRTLDARGIARAPLSPGVPLSLGPNGPTLQYVRVGEWANGRMATRVPPDLQYPISDIQLTHPLLLTYHQTAFLLPPDLPPAFQAQLLHQWCSSSTTSSAGAAPPANYAALPTTVATPLPPLSPAPPLPCPLAPAPLRSSALLLPLPSPQTGAWPLPELLALLRPALLLLPEGTTYPPASARTLAAYPAYRYDPARPLTLHLRNDGTLTLVIPPFR